MEFISHIPGQRFQESVLSRALLPMPMALIARAYQISRYYRREARELLSSGSRRSSFEEIPSQALR
jgi:hypothetical protein